MTSTGPVTRPTPWLVPPTYQFEGNDGNWSTFALEVGTPPQLFHIFPATVSQDILVPAALACEKYLTGIPNCGATRGVQGGSSGFKYNSTSYNQIGSIELTSEQNLFNGSVVIYGIDTASLSKSTDSGFGPQLTDQAIASYQDALDFWLGQVGLGTVSDSFSGQNYKSPLRSMKEQGLIPSLSFGYTAGKAYTNPQVPGSLILGGYDTARISGNNTLTVPISSVNSVTSLKVNVTSVTVSADLRGGYQNLGNGPMMMNIDSSTAQIWLPPQVCSNFATSLGLQQVNSGSPFGDNSTFYTVNDTVRTQLADSVFQFTISSGDRDLRIQIPYKAFDLRYSYSQNTSYFPIRQGTTGQLTLGRAFLQEAYIVVDWERSNMTIGQAASQNSSVSISPIAPTSDSTASVSASPSSHSSAGSKGSPVGGIVGGVVGGVLGLALIGLVIWFLRRRSKRKQASAKTLFSQDIEQIPTEQPPTAVEHYRDEVVKPPPQSPEPEEPVGGWYSSEKAQQHEGEKSEGVGVEAYELSSPGAGPAELETSQRHELAGGAVPNRGVPNRGELMSTPIHEMPGSEVGSELDVGGRRSTRRRTPDRAWSPPYGSASPGFHGTPSPELFMSPVGSSSSVQVVSSPAVHHHSSAQQEVMSSSEIVSSSTERDRLGGTTSEIVVSSAPQQVASPLPVRDNTSPLASQPVEAFVHSHERGNTDGGA